MSVAKRSVHGVTVHEPDRAYQGCTLFAPLCGKDVWLVNMEGEVVNRWEMEFVPGLYGEFMDNGNMLYGGKAIPTPLPEFGGNGGQVIEVDWDNNILWEWRNEYHSHSQIKLKNGNLLVALWREVPDEIAKKVKGGEPGTELKGVMWGEAIQEIDWRTKEVVWEWLSYEHLDPEGDALCQLCPRDRWTNFNATEELPNGDILVSARCISTIFIIDRKTGEITWRWGPGEISHQHNPTMLENGNILLFDNGAHRIYTTIDYSRVIEVNPKTDEIEWEYKENPPVDLNSFICSGAQRLPNGNTLICECTKGRIFEVTKEGDTVWEYRVPFYHEHPIFGTNNMIFRAYRYDYEHPALKGRTLDPSPYVGLDQNLPRFDRSPFGVSKQALGVSFET
ncbi:MAG: aryl-sulfate sulfotransferase [Proteobacteria bacterium]|nr:aryl-sulfate sulfotransferase [Pseudomonadota bacterium]